MIRIAGKIAPVGVLLLVAAACGYAAYARFAERPPTTDGWSRAAAVALRAEQTKAQLPALRMRRQAIDLFRTLAASGTPGVRSRAEMLVGLLLLGNANADPTQRQDVLAESADSLRRAVRLDRANDDAAFDLELLLSQAKASGRPIAQVPRRPVKHRGRPTTGEAGHGY